MHAFSSFDELKAETAGKAGHIIPFVSKQGVGCLHVAEPVAQLEVGTLQNALDILIKETEGATIDYIHGADVVNELGSKDGNMGFLLPSMDKAAFFPTAFSTALSPVRPSPWVRPTRRGTIWSAGALLSSSCSFL